MRGYLCKNYVTDLVAAKKVLVVVAVLIRLAAKEIQVLKQLKLHK